MTKHFLLITFILLAVITACSRGGEKAVGPVFDRMKEAGCAGNEEGFFSHIDREAVRDNVTKESVDRIKLGAYENRLPENAEELQGEKWRKAASEYAESVMELYREEVKRGRAGKICRMQIISVHKYTAKVKMPGEPDVTWTFGKAGGGLKLVSVY